MDNGIELLHFIYVKYIDEIYCEMYFFLSPSYTIYNIMSPGVMDLICTLILRERGVTSH